MLRFRLYSGKLWRIVGFALTALACLPPASAKAERVLYSFTGGSDSALPYGSLIRDKAGNLYGTTNGVYDVGTVFKLAPDGTETVLYAFTSNASDGQYPGSGLIRDKAGNLYGTTNEGGGGYDVCTYGCGIVFKVAPDGTETVLHAFTGTDGANPVSSNLFLDRHGNLYGVTYGGGSGDCTYWQGRGCGVVFKLKADGTLKVLHSFSGSDGRSPQGALIADQNGNFYGTTLTGGIENEVCSVGCGTVFRLTPDGTLTTLYSFQGISDGSSPFGPLVMDPAGNLYGTTIGGGSTCGGDLDGCGVAFKLAPDKTLTLLHIFEDSSDGGYPVDGLIADATGNLYGVTANGGLSCPFSSDGCGVAFKLTPDGTETVLHSFGSGSEGAVPEAGLYMDGKGMLFGTTALGGTDGVGTVFKLKN